jgi:hypothetical protein
LNVPVPVLVTSQYALVTSRRRRPDDDAGVHVGSVHTRKKLASDALFEPPGL